MCTIDRFMAKAVEEFPAHTRVESVLIAMDIKGFSGAVAKPGGLVVPRTDLIASVEATSLFAATSPGWAAQFLGDELRIAFAIDLVRPDEVFEFAAAVTRNLAKRTNAGEHTEVVGVVTVGGVTRGEWRECRFLHGEPVERAQRWMRTKRIGASQFAFETKLGVTGGDSIDFDGEKANLFSLGGMK